MSSLTEPELALQLLLHHEAAHMSACMMFEIPFDMAVISTGTWGGLRGYVRVTSAVDSIQIENEIIMYFVGIAAEARWLALHPGYGEVREANGASDIAQARELLSTYRLKVSGETHLRRRADAFVENRWGHIVELARLLGERRRVTARQARRVS